jgi:hypothetical protein
MEREPVVVAVDFDGTITQGDSWPEMGPLSQGSKWFINQIIEDGYCVVIFTCREGALAEEAKEFLKLNDIRYMHFNENCSIRKDKYRNDTRKIGADVYIDDRSVFILGEDICWGEIYNKIIRKYGVVTNGTCCNKKVH